MVRVRLATIVVGVLWAVSADAQPALYTGMLTGHIGAASDGDVRGASVTPGLSLGVIEDSGLGLEVDLGHTATIDSELFVESGITSLMINFMGMRVQHPRIRPFLTVGAGLLRVRADTGTGEPVTSRTDWGFSAGGGVLYVYNDALGVRGDVRYQRYFEGDDISPLADGFFDFWRTSIGVTFSWPLR